MNTMISTCVMMLQHNHNNTELQCNVKILVVLRNGEFNEFNIKLLKFSLGFRSGNRLAAIT